jgi:trk system potassium uptake protein TrkA
MNIIIAGCGRIGSDLALILSKAGHNVVIIDSEAAAFNRLGPAFNGLTVRGSACDDRVLRQAGIETCDAFVAATNSDSANIMAAEIASRVYKVPRVVGRQYLPEQEESFRVLGINFVSGVQLTVRPLLEKVMTEMSLPLTVRGGLEVLEFVAGPRIRERRVKDVEIPGEFRIGLVTRDGVPFIPTRDTVLAEKDTILAVVKIRSFAQVEPYMRGD